MPAKIASRLLLLLLAALLLLACGAPATPIPTPTVAPAATPTATVMLLTQAEPAAPPTATAAPASRQPAPAATAAPAGPRPTATDEPDDCDRSVGSVFGWYDAVSNYHSGELAQGAAAIKSPCAEDRRMGLWYLGSVHDPAALPTLHDYLAAHPDGDWLRDEFDMTAVASAAIAYIEAPFDPQQTYAVDNLLLYDEPKLLADDAPIPSPDRFLAAGSKLQLLEEVKTGETRPDHGGETDIVFRHVRLEDGREFFVEVSRYVASFPRFFERPVIDSP